MKKISDCREWGSPYNNSGYPAGPKGSRGMAAHRWVWIQLNGPIPKGMVVRHTCDNRKCIRYSHLMIGTYSDNSNDAGRQGRMGHSIPIALREEVILELRNGVSIYECSKTFDLPDMTVRRIKWTYIDGIPRDRHPY